VRTLHNDHIARQRIEPPSLARIAVGVATILLANADPRRRWRA
jgi:hypothetical protein